MPKTLAEGELHRLARLGAITRLKEIEEEAAAIRSAFPGLAATAQPTDDRAPARRTRRKRQVSPEAREAARKRMLDYWAKRKSQAAEAGPATTAAERANGQSGAKRRKARAAKRARAKKGR